MSNYNIIFINIIFINVSNTVLQGFSMKFLDFYYKLLYTYSIYNYHFLRLLFVFFVMKYAILINNTAPSDKIIIFYCLSNYYFY
jgi:hypothetical protein